MIRGSLPELIVERRFGPLRIGQELSEVRSVFADTPDLDSFWVWVRDYNIGYFDFGGLEIVGTPDGKGVLRISDLFVKPQRERVDRSENLVRFEFDYGGLDASQTLAESRRILEPYGVVPQLRIQELISYRVGETTNAIFYLDDEENELGTVLLYSLEVK